LLVDTALVLLANLVVEDPFAGVELLGRARVRQPELERRASSVRAMISPAAVGQLRKNWA
jgi:hypothetical protein